MEGKHRDAGGKGILRGWTERQPGKRLTLPGALLKESNKHEEYFAIISASENRARATVAHNRC